MSLPSHVNAHYFNELKQALLDVSTAEKAESSRRYFPHGVNCLGANASDIKTIIRQFQQDNPTITAIETLGITEFILSQAQYNEEVLLAFGLINKWVKNNYDDNLLVRFKFWLEHYASNWSMVDDLCIKTLYQFLIARPHLIEQTQDWAYSASPWCRRASNVAWVKFINRKIGKSIYQLDPKLVFNNCNVLLLDKDEFVQKSIGWLLKATSVYHEQLVINYINENVKNMPRATIRYAIEKMDAQARNKIRR